MTRSEHAAAAAAAATVMCGWVDLYVVAHFSPYKPPVDDLRAGEVH